MRAIYQFCEKKQTEYPDGKTEVSKSLLWVTIALRAKGIRATLHSVSSRENMTQAGWFYAIGTRGTMSTAYEVSNSQKRWRPEIIYNASETRALKSKSIYA